MSEESNEDFSKQVGFARLVEDFSKQTWQMRSALILFGVGKFLSIITAVMIWALPSVAAVLLAIDGVCIALCVAFCVHNMLESFFDFAEEILLCEQLL